jgi:hypothetical protein
MSEIVTDLSVSKNWIARKGFNNQFTLTFLLSEVVFPITNYTFTLYIRKPGGTTNLVTLTQGSGLTNGGASGILTVLLSAANTATIDAGGYYFEIDYSLSGTSSPLMHGTFNLLDQLSDFTTSQDQTVEVVMEGTNVDISISLIGNSLSVSTQTSTATLTPNGSFDAYELTAQAVGLTIANPSTDYSNFLGFMVRFYTASSQTFALGDKYRAQGEAFITNTTAGKTHILTAIRDSATNKYDTRITIQV